MMIDQRIRLGVDLDGVVVDLWSEFKKQVKKNYGIKLNDEQNLVNYDTETCSSLTRDQVWSIFKHGKKLYTSAKPICGAVKCLKKLNQTHSIYFITHRNFYHSIKSDTWEWLKKYNIQYNDVIFTDHNKKQNVLDANVEYMIEDKGETALDLAESGQKMLLLDYPYNRNFDHKNIIRVYSWHDILDKLIEIEEHEYI